MIRIDVADGEEFLQVLVGQRVPQVPTDHQYDHLRREPYARERRLCIARRS